MQKDFKCKCGRKQRRMPKMMHGGITVKEAEKIGWRLIGGKWTCPFCCGNTDALFAVFESQTQPPTNAGLP